jgi:glycosyltransferase involved in cell wall biosynthesis
VPKLSVITHYYNHPEYVEEQLTHWQKIPPHLLNEIEFIIVDDNSENQPMISKGSLNLRHFRVLTDIPWNQAGARNLGAFHATGEWALFFDVDQKWELETVGLLLNNLDNLSKQTMFYLQIRELIDITVNKPLSNHPNTFLVHLPTFRVLGMYDEDFTGHYGYEDLYMPRVWEARGGKRSLINQLVFFEDMPFGTSNFDRDLMRNQQLMLAKLGAGCKNSPGILRFEWEETVLE